MMFTIDEIKRLVIYALGISIFTFYIYSYEELTCADQMKSIKISLDVIQRCDYKKLGTLGFFEKEQKKFELTKHMHNICNRAKEISPQNQDMEYYYKIFYYCTIFALHNTVDDTFFSVLETHLEKIEVQNA